MRKAIDKCCQTWHWQRRHFTYMLDTQTPPIARGRLASGDVIKSWHFNQRMCQHIWIRRHNATAVVKPVLVVVVAPNADYLADWTRSGTGPVDRSHHRVNRNGSGTVPLRSHREVVGSFRNDWTQWNRSEHGQLERFWNGSGTVPVSKMWCEHGLRTGFESCWRNFAEVGTLEISFTPLSDLVSKPGEEKYPTRMGKCVTCHGLHHSHS